MRTFSRHVLKYFEKVFGRDRDAVPCVAESTINSYLLTYRSGDNEDLMFLQEIRECGVTVLAQFDAN